MAEKGREYKFHFKFGQKVEVIEQAVFIPHNLRNSELKDSLADNGVLIHVVGAPGCLQISDQVG